MAAHSIEAAPLAPRPIALPEPRVRPTRDPLVRASLRTVRSPLGLLGMVILVVLATVATLAPLIAPDDPLKQHRGSELVRPGPEFLLGTDHLGRDLLSRVIYGARPSLLVALVVVTLGGGVGILSGLLAGFFGGWIDAVLMRVFDALFAFPSLLLGFVVAAILGPGTMQVAYAIAIAVIPSIARVARSLVLRERPRDYVLAARCSGATNARIMLQHVLPNAVAPLIVNLTLMMGVSVLAEASLAFLGLGTQPPMPSWGVMLNESRGYLRAAPWLAVWPGVVLALLLLGLNYLADALREAVDPRRVNVGP